MNERELSQEIKELLMLYASEPKQTYNSRKHYPKGVQGVDKIAKYVLSKEEYEVMSRKIGLESCEKQPYTPSDCSKKKVIFFSALHYKKTPVKEICSELGYKRKEVWEILQKGVSKLKDYHERVQEVGEDEALLESKMQKSYNYDLKSEFGKRGLGRIDFKIKEIEEKHGIKISAEIYHSIGETLKVRDHIMNKSFHEAGFSDGLQRAIYDAGYHTNQEAYTLRLPISNIKDFKKFSLEEIAMMGNMGNHLEELKKKLDELGIVLQSN